MRYVRAAARKVRELRDDLLHEGRKHELEILGNRVPLRLHDLHLFADAEWIVRAYLRPESVFERGDDATPRCVVLGVRARDHEQVKRKTDPIPANLYVLLFHDVEEADLDSLRKVGELVDAEDPAIGARQQAVVDGQLVGEVPPLGDLDRVDLSDEVGDGDVGGGELLTISLVALDPRNLDGVAIFGDEVEASPADRRVRVVVDLAACNRRHERIEEADERAHDAALRLAALAEHDHVVSRDHRIRELRQHGLVIADNSGEERFAAAKSRQQIAAHLLFDVFTHMAGGPKFANCPSGGGGHHQHYRQAARLQTGVPANSRRSL